MEHLYLSFFENTKDLNNKDIISNRCYLGYSKNNNLYSFVHGNTTENLQGFSQIKLF